jgi:hypothetical protein
LKLGRNSAGFRSLTERPPRAIRPAPISVLAATPPIPAGAGQPWFARHNPRPANALRRTPKLPRPQTASLARPPGRYARALFVVRPLRGHPHSSPLRYAPGAHLWCDHLRAAALHPPPVRSVAGLPGRERPHSPCAADAQRARDAPLRGRGCGRSRLIRQTGTSASRRLHSRTSRPCGRAPAADCSIFPPPTSPTPKQLQLGETARAVARPTRPRQTTSRWRGRILPAARSLRSLAGWPKGARAQGWRKPFVRPCTRRARPGAGEGGRGEREGVGAAAGSVSPRRVHVPRRGLILHPGCYGSSHNRPFCPISAQSSLRPRIPSGRRIPSRPPEAARFGMWTEGRIVRSATGRTPGGESSSSARGTRSICSPARPFHGHPEGSPLRCASGPHPRCDHLRAPALRQRRPCRQPSVLAISPALRAPIMAPPPPWSLVGGRSSSRLEFRNRWTSPCPAPGGPCSLAALVRGPSPRRPERRGCPARPRRAASLAARRAAGRWPAQPAANAGCAGGRAHLKPVAPFCTHWFAGSSERPHFSRCQGPARCFADWLQPHSTDGRPI